MSRSQAPTAAPVWSTDSWARCLNKPMAKLRQPPEVMNNYRHTQQALWLPALVLVAGLIPVGISFFALAHVPLVVLIIVPILLLVGWNFHSLTIEIAGDELHWRFGPGWIRKKVGVAEILSATPVR